MSRALRESSGALRARVALARCAVLALGIMAFTIAGGAEAEKGPDLPRVGIGYEPLAPLPEQGPIPTPLSDAEASPENPLYFRLEVPWARVETGKGAYEWGGFDPIVDRFRANGNEVVLELSGGNPLYGVEPARAPAPQDEEAIAGWEKFVRAAADHFKGRIRFWQIGKAPDDHETWGEDSARSYAFILKRSAVQIRAEMNDPVVVTGGLTRPEGAWLDRFFSEGVAPYVDVVSIRADGATSLAEECRKVVTALRTIGAAPGIWVEGLRTSPSDEADGGRAALVRSIFEAFEEGISTIFVALPFDANGIPSGGDDLLRVHVVVPHGAGRVPSADRFGFVDPAGVPITGVKVVTITEPTEGLSVVAYWAEAALPEGAGDRPAATARIVARRPGPPVLYDPLDGSQARPEAALESGGARLDLPLSTSPRILLFREGVTAAAEPDERASLEVTAARGITAEEVIAHHREFQARQDERLQHYSSDVMLDYHFRIGGANRSLDISIKGTFFFDPKVGAEWELKDYYVAGNLSRWKTFPEIPFIQPEKVLTLPLDITFDRSYTYTYEGEETVEGRACHVLGFEPADPSRSLYRGRVWIDTTSWARVRVDSIQTHVEAPFLSNEERTIYEPLPAPDGGTLWLMTRLRGQQSFSVAGRALVAIRDVTFTEHEVNAPTFAAEREEAYASTHRMLRDTDHGLRYLERTETGERQLKPDFDTNQFFGLAGAIYDPSLPHVLPLAGVNYFDYDFRKTGVQTNLFFAGLFLAWNVTKPDIGGSGFDLGGDLTLSALGREDKDFPGGVEAPERAVERREQSLSLNVSREIGDFVHVITRFEVGYTAFGDAEDTDPEYILPTDTLVQTAYLRGSFNRSGFEVRASGSYSWRSDFAFWGDPCQRVPDTGGFYLSDPPPFCTPKASSAGIADPDERNDVRTSLRNRRDSLRGDDFDPDAEDYIRYGAAGVKEFFLPAFQKLRFVLELYGGGDLDRFSRYSFDRLDSGLRGFSGSGIRFDEGAIARAAYVFNVADVIRFEGGIEHARVRTNGDDLGFTGHTGLALSGTFLGPWQTIWQVEYGYALASDVEEAKGDQELLLGILKLF